MQISNETFVFFFQEGYLKHRVFICSYLFDFYLSSPPPPPPFCSLSMSFFHYSFHPSFTESRLVAVSRLFFQPKEVSQNNYRAQSGFLHFIIDVEWKAKSNQELYAQCIHRETHRILHMSELALNFIFYFIQAILCCTSRGKILEKLLSQHMYTHLNRNSTQFFAFLIYHWIIISCALHIKTLSAHIAIISVA